MNVPVSPSTAVLILDIPAEIYSPSWIRQSWTTLVASQCCPACTQTSGFAHHGQYQKYHYQRRILILRVRCLRCRCTHALLPAFSLPGTSAGTPEVESYLQQRAGGQSRQVAAVQLRACGMGPRYGQQLERRLESAISRAKALWPRAAPLSLRGLQWIRAACGQEPSQRPLYALNTYGLARGINPLCFCRVSILQFATTGRTPHNLGPPGGAAAPIRSPS